MLAKPSLGKQLGLMRWNDTAQSVPTSANFYSNEDVYDWVATARYGYRQLLKTTEFGDVQFREPLRMRISYFQNKDAQKIQYGWSYGGSQDLPIDEDGQVKVSWAVPLSGSLKVHDDMLFSLSDDGTQTGNKFVWGDAVNPSPDPAPSPSITASTITGTFSQVPATGSATFVQIIGWGGGYPGTAAFISIGGSSPTATFSYTLPTSDYWHVRVFSTDTSFSNAATVQIDTQHYGASWSHHACPKIIGIMQAFTRWKTLAREMELDYDGTLNPGPSGRLVAVELEDPNEWWRMINNAQTESLYDQIAQLAAKKSYPNYKGGDSYLAPFDEFDFKNWEQFWQTDSTGTIKDAWSPVETNSLTYMRCIRSQNTGNAATNANDGQGCLFSFQESVLAEAIVAESMDEIVPADIAYETPDDWTGGLEIRKLLDTTAPGPRTASDCIREIREKLAFSKRSREVEETLEDTDHGHRGVKGARKYVKRARTAGAA